MTREEQIAKVRAVAEQAGNRAYMFVRDGDGLAEVRVWPSGYWEVTPVDENGVAIGQPEGGSE